MKQFAKKSLVLFIALFFTAALSAKTPKYIFYCIGDGMSFAHVMATQLFYENGNYEDGNESLVFLDFPVRSAIRTYANNSLITCSAAAGTALATGHKTNLAHIGIGPDKQPLTSVAKQLRDKGYAIGIITSGQLDDATPAAFYAGQMRNDTYQIGKKGADSQFDFLAGSTLMKPFNRRDPSQPYIYDYYRQKGYTVCRGPEGYNSQKNADKILLVDTDTTLKKWLPYVIEREPGKLGLEFMVQAGIEKLYKKKNKKGFFMMIEGASIDHASHPRDIATAIKETIEFDRSVRLAYEFYKKHPDETLIIVTADHETGGLTIGETTTHPFNWEYVNYQKMSKESLSKLFQKMRETGEIDTWEKTKKILAENTGLWDKIPVNAGEEAQLMQCYYETIVKKSSKHEITLYAKSEPLVADAIALLNKKIGVGWTSFSHTGGFVPFYAIGCQARQFGALNDNIEIPNTIRKIMKIK